MYGMINCMKFKPKEGEVDAMFKALAEYIRDYPFGGIHHAIIDLGTGEYALIGSGAVITKDIPPYSLVIGNPGRVVGQVDKKGKRIKNRIFW